MGCVTLAKVNISAIQQLQIPPNGPPSIYILYMCMCFNLSIKDENLIVSHEIVEEKRIHLESLNEFVQISLQNYIFSSFHIPLNQRLK